MRRKTIVLFILAFSSVSGAVACGVGWQAEAPGEPPAKVQEKGQDGVEPGWPLKPEREPHENQQEEIEEGEAA
jgi:hypothetical protein